MYKQLELCRHLYMFYFIEHMLGQSANILVFADLFTVLFAVYGQFMFHCVYMHYYYIVPQLLPIDLSCIYVT